MKRLFVLCAAAAMLLLAACSQQPHPQDETTLPSASGEAPGSSRPALAASETMFTVTEHQLIPPKQAFGADFEAFYEEFTAAVRNKDMQFIESILDDEVRFSFGGKPGKDDFQAHWSSEDQLWAELEAIIALGGRYYQADEYTPGFGKCFVAPYVYTDFSEDLDAFGHFAVIDKDVPVYKEESAASEVIATLDYNIVQFHNNSSFWDKDPDAFVGITTLSGETGHIQKKYLRSPNDYRLCIEQKGDEWKLLWLIAGD